ncbi:MAG: hypothetical protein EKK42_32850 [Pseudonocardiaceae bacterium]|nr:MAG: hypothetical protein EKK42_32850 [Pseudonocardiaceae bacterium]
MSNFIPIPHLVGEPLTKAQLSALTGETLAELDTAVRNGAPVTRTGGVRSPLIFDSAQFFAWVQISEAERLGGPQFAKIARLEIERDALMLALEKSRGTGKE